MTIRELAPEDFPANLREIPGVPKKLWAAGSFPPEGTKLLAVVGSRALSPYGRQACEQLVSGLAGYPISIVSGLALGADACAHEAALAAGLHTIAIPGSGLDESVIGPKTNLGLAKRILQSGGLLLSEHEPLHEARPYDFPSRNRIMTGLSDTVLIIEAGEQSGTLITMRLAADYNRDLLVIPHRIGDPHGYGPHLFARLGATLVTESAHILEALRIPIKESSTEKVAPKLSGVEKIIWDLLEEPKARDEILRAGGAGAAELLTALMSLELRSLIKESYGLWRRA